MPLVRLWHADERRGGRSGRSMRSPVIDSLAPPRCILRVSIIRPLSRRCQERRRGRDRAGEAVLLSDPVASLHWIDDSRATYTAAVIATNTIVSSARCALPAAKHSTRGSICCAACRRPSAASTAAAGCAVEANITFETLRAGPRTPNGPLPRRHGPRLDRGGQLPRLRSYTRHGAATIGAGKNIYSCAYRVEVTCYKNVTQIAQLTLRLRPTPRRAPLRKPRSP